MAPGIEYFAGARTAMLKNVHTYLLVFIALACAAPVLAANDPTIAEVYEAASTGHLDQAQQMMRQVLQDHPRSARAHYVEAELSARGGDYQRARQELDTALRLQPGMQFASPESVRALQAELAQRELAKAQSIQSVPPESSLQSAFPLRTVLLVLGGICVLWLIIRRRTPSGGLYSQYPSAVPPAGGPMNYGGPGVASGMGSGIAGGLASGLAVGAGVVAGEELAHHFLDGNRHGVGTLPAGNESPGVPDSSELGGSDFGVSDASTWDDNSESTGGDVGGGDDWG
jgi:uncharacterized protein